MKLWVPQHARSNRADRPNPYYVIESLQDARRAAEEGWPEWVRNRCTKPFLDYARSAGFILIL